MKVLIIGNGGREHALAWKVAQSPLVTEIFVAPGNAGTALETKVTNIAINPTDVEALLSFAKKTAIDLTIVGPEAPLVLGIVDTFNQANLLCFGPNQYCAQLEGSKTFAKDFLHRHKIPTAAYATFTDVKAAEEYIHQQGAPLVIKADGLAAGKGVVIAHDTATAIAAVRDMLVDARFGQAGARVVIEQFLEGQEVSFIVMVDGKSILPFATSQDHKARFDSDTGPNTGGMGAYSPAPLVDLSLHNKIMQTVIKPTVEAMAAEGHPYCGFLYAGLMIDKNNDPQVLEFNCRLGDPETQPLLMRLQTDLVTLCQAACKGQLAACDIQWDTRFALGVVMVAEGYPNDYRSGDTITGLPTIADKDCKIFHAGTKNDGNEIKTAGGRVLCVTALGDTVKVAQEKAYQTVKTISWPGAGYRTDIGYRAL